MFLVGKDKAAKNVTMNVKLLKVDDNKICIDVARVDGDVFAFHYQFNEIKDYLGELIDTTY